MEIQLSPIEITQLVNQIILISASAVGCITRPRRFMYKLQS